MNTDLEEALAEPAHVRSARIVAKAALACMLVISLCQGVVSSYTVMHHVPTPEAWTVGSFLARLTLMYVWYYYDAIRYAYHRSRAADIGVIAVALLAVPYYLVRSRPQGRRATAILLLIGFMFLNLLCIILGAILERMAAAAL